MTPVHSITRSIHLRGRPRGRFALGLSLLLALPALAAEEFPACRERLAAHALAQGIPPGLVEATVPALEQQQRVLELDQQQPEFIQTFAAYVDRRVSPERVSRGRQMLAKHGDFLADLQRRHGVPARYLVAFWGLETNYGGYLGNMPTLDSLATLACDPRRATFFTREFVNALRLMDRESLEAEHMVGSWAGAVGHTQFMPSSYLRYAVDGDGDGKIDLWRSERDALASGANFLKALGWQPGLRWGRLVRLPPDFDYRWAGRDQSAPLASWSSRGVLRANGGPLPGTDVTAALLVPAGHAGPAFLVYDNFDVIMRWNQSQSYALSVGLLADRLAGAPPADYGDPETPPLPIAELKHAQQALLDRGLDPGPLDGVLGSRTRAALRAFQLEVRLPADGYPDAATLNALRADAAE
ncbi:lytic murein transglycosylase [Parahaliea mediterranea]|uniref:Lytic murein transglycosylase n=1 Tax=Parahaliea mediterranea TaxID=651086 RepID=A0A939DGE3_9GAMM|nr:lytic murein transglycosylase [Parahaliea mediterranea]MBN7797825.1 lytic murein transglycosylase [Parahaliea mediterranea]